MPLIGLVAGAIFGGSALVATSAFMIGIAAVIITGIILKKFKVFAGEPAPFVIELPTYHMPSLSNVLRSTWERGWSFIKRAGTLILASSIVLWFLQSFGFENGAFTMVDDNEFSILADLGRAISWIFYPLGWVGSMAWKATVATITGLIAKEEVVNCFGILYHAGEVSEEGQEIWAAVAADFTALTAYSFMIFQLLCAPCFAAMGAIKREMNNGKWFAFAIGYMTVFAYVVAMIVYQIGGLITGEVSFNFFTIVAFAALAGLIYLLCRKGYKPEKETVHLSGKLDAASAE
jgi:ferrous iron transport protein B